jgi:hypothetical protein
VCASFLSAVQPSRLRAYLADLQHGGRNDDGLFQRIQLLAWPDPSAHWQLVDRPPAAAAQARATSIFSTLIKLDAQFPLILHFAEEDRAQEEFFSWLTDLETELRGEPMPGFLVSHLAKYRSLVPSLAGLFELADHASLGDLPDNVTIDRTHLEQAIRFSNYLRSHALRAYSCVFPPELSAGRELLHHIQKGNLGDSFTTRDVYRPGWFLLKDSRSAEKALECLASKFWIRKTQAAQREPGDGRPPSEQWRVNPKCSSKKQA